MTVNRGSRLKPAYFKSYLSLIMSTHECDLDCARQHTIETFFKGDPEYYGAVSRDSFEEAVESLRETN
ncbi:hypothetical protein [Planococcus sp. ISL-109]|uniref:hypothetical protein n=1 Tax=Planococcus sp. ISL-109 TaxID=2819166 RepID=UPI001BEBDB77|nr:hypothetical protein [Planococcus sp. ISL-109]MBT2581609.1 hypothetical protein [Planococcus sp. ISL-109]